MSYPVPAPRCASALLALALSATLLAGCQPAAEAPTLSTHAVPPARAQAIASAINATFSQNEGHAALGRAEVAAPGTLLVRAPASLQPSIAAAIKGLEGAQDDPPPMQSLHVDAWWLTADALSPLPADLKDLPGALGDDSTLLGVRDRLSLGLASGGSPADANGEWMAMQVRAFPVGDAMTLSINVRESRPQTDATRTPMAYEGQVRAKPGQWVVLTTRANGSGGSEALVLRVRAE